MNRITRVVTGFAVCLSVAALAACSGGSAGANASSSPTGGTSASALIGISVKTITNDPFQSAWVEAAQAKVKELGGEAQVLTAGGQTAVATQVSQINDLVAKHVTGLIVDPIDGAAVVPALTKAKDAGIHVVIVDSPVASGHEDLYETFISTDNVKAGTELATYLVDNIGKANPKVAIVQGAPGSIAGDDRNTGFLAGLATKNVKPVASASGQWSNDQSLVATENILTANPDLDAILSASDVMVDGILQALAGAGKVGVKVLSIDGSKVGIQGVIGGKLMADNTQDPQAMGTLAAEKIIGLANGSIKPGSLEKFVDSGTTTVTTDNAAEALAKAF
jgi:ribose transport system substrate-binding protein